MIALENLESVNRTNRTNGTNYKIIPLELLQGINIQVVLKILEELEEKSKTKSD